METVCSREAVASPFSEIFRNQVDRVLKATSFKLGLLWEGTESDDLQKSCPELFYKSNSTFWINFQILPLLTFSRAWQWRALILLFLLMCIPCSRWWFQAWQLRHFISIVPLSILGFNFVILLKNNFTFPLQNILNLLVTSN